MKVAMRLGLHRWKRLGGEKKVDSSTVREVALWGISLLGIAPFLFVCASYFKGVATTPPVDGAYHLLPATGTFLFMFLTLMSGAFGVVFSLVAGTVFARSLFATLRFQTVFGFSPPVTIEGRRAVELAIKKILAIRARDLDEIYEREKRTLKGIESYECDSASCYSDDALQKIGKNVASIEYYDLGDLEKAKKQAKKGFYSARDAARNPCLPFPFKSLPDSFKEYLNYLPKKAE